jgi:ABC-type multidrug transport system permease subunit
MLECQMKEEYTKTFNTKGEYNSAESLFMALIFRQNIINQLIAKLSSK